MSDLTPMLIESLRGFVRVLGKVDRPCWCNSSQQAWGDPTRQCMECRLANARALIAEYDAANALALPCDNCARPGHDVVLQYDFDGEVTAQCRACYATAREREMAVTA